jgi:hypothetical protein
MLLATAHVSGSSSVLCLQDTLFHCGESGHCILPVPVDCVLLAAPHVSSSSSVVCLQDKRFQGFSMQCCQESTPCIHEAATGDSLLLSSYSS